METNNDAGEGRSAAACSARRFRSVAELKNHIRSEVEMDDFLHALRSKIKTRKHAENFAGNTHTASIKSEGIYGAGKTPAEARRRLIENLKREGRLHLYLPNAQDHP